MNEDAQVSRLVGDIYDVALDPALWPGALRKIAEFVGGPAAAIYAKETVRRSGNVFYVSGIEPDFVQTYFDKYVKLDPFTVTRFFFAVEEVVSTENIMPHSEFRETLFYKEWARPQGWIDFVSAALEKSATSYAECCVFRHERDGVTDAEARRKMRLLVPHIRRAVLIGKVIDLHRVEAAALADALDGLAAAMFLVDAGGRIVHANVAGHVLAAEESVLRGAGGRLAAIEVEAHRALGDILASVGNDDATLGVKGVALPLAARNGERHVAHVLPLTAGARRRAGVAYSAAAAVFVRRADMVISEPPEVIAKAYRLTPSELRVLLAVVEVGGVPEVARVLGISETTVKTHLQRVFAKTGSNRQADLVKLVAGYMSPIGFAGPPDARNRLVRDRR